MTYSDRLNRNLARWLHPWHWPCIVSVACQPSLQGLEAVIEVDTTRHMGFAGTQFTIRGLYLDICTTCEGVYYAPLERLVPLLLTGGVIAPIEAQRLNIAVHLPGDGHQLDDRIGSFLKTIFEHHAGWVSVWVPDSAVENPEAHLMLSVWGDHDPQWMLENEPPAGCHVPFTDLVHDMESSDVWIDAIRDDPKHGLYRYVAARPYCQTLDVADLTFAQRCFETMTGSTMWQGLETTPAAKKAIADMLAARTKSKP